MSFTSKRQDELNKKGMYSSNSEKEKKEKPKKSYKDLSIIPDYNAKMNMLDPGSKLSKVIGIMIVVGLILYFCNVYIGFLLVIAGIVMYTGLWAALKIKEKRAKKQDEEKKE